MTTYSINIDYTKNITERKVQEIGIEWNSIEQAKKALACINEHFTEYKSATGYRSSDEPEFDLEAIKDKPWYHGPLDPTEVPDAWYRNIVIEKDDGSKVAVSVFWNGYFDVLHMAEVCIANSATENDSGMRIYF